MKLTLEQRAANAAEYQRRLLAGTPPSQQGPRAEAPTRPRLTEAEVEKKWRAIQRADALRDLPTAENRAPMSCHRGRGNRQASARREGLAQVKEEVVDGCKADPEIPYRSQPERPTHVRPVDQSEPRHAAFDHHADPNANPAVRDEARRVLDNWTRPALTFQQEQALARLDSRMPNSGPSEVATHQGASMTLNPCSEAVAAQRCRDLLATGHRPVAAGNPEALLQAPEQPSDG